MSSNQRKGDVKLVTLEKSLVKVVAGDLNIFTEVQKDKFEIQKSHKWLQILLQSSLKPELGSFCSANNKPTKLFFGDDLTKHVKELTMTNKLKTSESFYQSKYSNNKY